MRLIHTFHDDRQARAFSLFLIGKGIENHVEAHKETDWGSDTYGDILCYFWIVEEDDLERAKELLKEYLENPTDPRFTPKEPLAPPPFIENKEESIQRESVREKLLRRLPPIKKEAPFISTATFYLLLLSIFCFLFSVPKTPLPQKIPEGIPSTPFFISPLKKAFYYDYPNAYVQVDRLIQAYGVQALEKPNALPAEGKFLLLQIAEIPHWNGIYDSIVATFRAGSLVGPGAIPMFEKIREGELWRLFTPCFLHLDFFHILFNMLWLFVLGKQIEQKIGIPRYLLFTLIVGIFSNTAQYLMSGPNFMGYSGILCGMIAFVWYRQKRAPWEGYQLQPSTVTFVTAFILVMFALQLFAFFIEIAGYEIPFFPIANTAHLSGAFAGYLIARWETLSRRK